MTNTDETKDKLYEHIEYVISAIPAADFNARVGKEYWRNEGPENSAATDYSFFRPVL